MAGVEPDVLAFLGCGGATRTHSRTLAHTHPDLRRRYASRDPGRAEEFRREHGGDGAYGSYEDAMEDPEVDIVLVATPPSSHRELTLRALDAGKHVIVEKPAFPRTGDFDAVGRRARERGRRVLVAENYHYKPVLRTLRRLLREGAVGEPLFVRVNAVKRQRTGGWRDDPDHAGGGALMEGGIHWIDFMASLGFAVEEVRGHRPGPGKGPERSAVVVLRYAEGPVGTLHYSWEVPSLLQGLRISRVYGREGTITFESNGVFVLSAGRRWHFTFPGFRDISGYRGMFRDFFAALREGREPEMTLEKARRDVRLVEEAYRDMGGPGPGGGPTGDGPEAAPGTGRAGPADGGTPDAGGER